MHDWSLKNYFMLPVSVNQCVNIYWSTRWLWRSPGQTTRHQIQAGRVSPGFWTNLSESPWQPAPGAETAHSDACPVVLDNSSAGKVHRSHQRSVQRYLFFCIMSSLSGDKQQNKVSVLFQKIYFDMGQLFVCSTELQSV